MTITKEIAMPNPSLSFLTAIPPAKTHPYFKSLHRIYIYIYIGKLCYVVSIISYNLFENYEEKI